jgi:NhaP-type Na+/H+ or K+/H+ antiporter
MTHVELFALVVGAVGISALCRRWGWSPPLVLVAAGLVVSFVPGMPRFDVDSAVILEFVLPPLLYSAALSSSYQDFRRARNSILRLGVGLVLVTAIAVAVVAWPSCPTCRSPRRSSSVRSSRRRTRSPRSPSGAGWACHDAS